MISTDQSVQYYLQVFPNDEKLKDNIKFYRNEIKSKPFPGEYT